jgi:aspartyl-tRNA(Asn)/glutamyl-tRNA(Gln) amidotransferase subunit C
MNTDFNVRYVAELARLSLSEPEIAQFQDQLASILSHVDKLKGVDVEGVEPTAHTTPVFNVFRADEPVSRGMTDTILKNAPRQASGLIIVPAVIG